MSDVNEQNAMPEEGDIAPAPESTTDPSITFRMSTRIEERLVVGRDDAVAAAKEWSLESGQTVAVERMDGRVKMGFRDGGLVDYVYETRKGRRA